MAISETDIAKKVVAWLQEQRWDVYQEVQFRQYGPVADIAAVQNGKLWIIECKTALTFTVLEQARAWRAHFRSVAVPEARNMRGRNLAYEIAHRYLRLGVIEVPHDGVGSFVDAEMPAPLMREFHKFAKEMIGRLREEQKGYAPAGSKNGGHYTPYRATMDRVRDFIAKNPGCTLREIMDWLDHQHHYSSDQTARQSIRMALENWERGWCRVEKENRQILYFSNE